MDITTFVSSTILSLVAGALLCRVFLPAYLTEKAKNLASKEDLGHLTKLIEEVKFDYVSRGQVIERRRRVYEEVCVALRVFAEKIGGDDAKNKFHLAHATAWLWASDEVLSALNYFIKLQIQHAAIPGSVNQDVLKSAYTEILIAMRRDLGFIDTSMTNTDYLFVEF